MSYRSFALPQPRPDEDLIRVLAVEHARAYLARFREEFGQTMQRRTAGVLELLDTWLARESDFDTVWDPALVLAQRSQLSALSPPPALIARRAAAVALHLCQSGHPGEWEARIPRSTRLRWGRWLLPPGRHLRVSARAGQATIRIQTESGATHVEFRRRRGDWHSRQAIALPCIRVDRHQCLIVPRLGLSTLEFSDPDFQEHGRTQGHVVAACRRAVTLLRRHAPRYLSWVDRVLRGVIPCRSVTTRYRSGSDNDYPGFVQMSFPAEAAAHAEMLVHESAHQYFHLLTRLGRPDDGSDRRLHYSPVRRMGRPIDKILLAYHAFANVLLFYRDCRRTRLADDGYCRANEEALLPQLEQLEAPLRASRALTPVGRALWAPLAARIH